MRYVLFSGFPKGFNVWGNNKSVNYYYDIVDENGESVPLKDGRTEYILQDKIITVNLK